MQTKALMKNNVNSPRYGNTLHLACCLCCCNLHSLLPIETRKINFFHVKTVFSQTSIDVPKSFKKRPKQHGLEGHLIQRSPKQNLLIIANQRNKFNCVVYLPSYEIYESDKKAGRPEWIIIIG